MITRQILSTLLLAVLVLASGCASVTRGTKDKLKVVSEPAGASIKLSTGQTGITPATFVLPRKKGVVVELSKPGYEAQAVIVSSKFSGTGGAALAGNVLIGGLIGAGIDGLSGATLSLKPNPVSVTLQPVASASPDPASSPEESSNTVAVGSLDSATVSPMPLADDNLSASHDESGGVVAEPDTGASAAGDNPGVVSPASSQEAEDKHQEQINTKATTLE